MRKKGFTLIELIVVMAIISILVLLGVPKYKQYTEEAQLTRVKVNIKELESASMQYYMSKGDWPRLNDVAYSSEQIEDFGKEILDKTGAVVTLELEGKYYDIDFTKINNYIKLPDDNINYILQNPVGNIFYIEGVTEEAKTRLEVHEMPISVITMTEGVLYTNTVLSFTSDSIGGSGYITKTEWQLDEGTIITNIDEIKLSAGEHTVKLRVTNSLGDISEWYSKTFIVNDVLGVSVHGMPGYSLPSNTVVTAGVTYSTYIPKNTIDGNTLTRWNSSLVNDWIQYIFPNPVKIKYLNFCSDSTPSSYQTYTIQGFKNGVWVNLGTHNVYVMTNNLKGVILNPILISEDYYDGLKVTINAGKSWVAFNELTIN